MEITVGTSKVLIIYQINSSDRCIFDNIKDVDFQVAGNLFEVYHNGALAIVQKIQANAITINDIEITIENVFTVLKSLMNFDSNGNNNSNGGNGSNGSNNNSNEQVTIASEVEVFDTVGGYVEGQGNQTPSIAPANVKAIVKRAIYRLGKWNLPNGDRDYVLLHGLKGVGTTIKIIDIKLTLTDNNGKDICAGSLFFNQGGNTPSFMIYPNGNVNEQADRITIRRRGDGGTTNDNRFGATLSSGAASRGEIMIEYREYQPINK